ncbi:MAG: hypothetical protein R3337_00060 [Gammaproteobacteria bacterium]|nr:hypothetical protein [Gammaproteobacteria bacterium]
MGIDYRETLAEQTPTVLQGEAGRRWRMVLGALVDAMGQANREALTRHWLRRGFPIADDCLEALGHQRNLERYPVETKPQYRARVDQAWPVWESCGPQAMIDQFAAAGYPGVRIMYEWSPDLPVVSPPSYRTQFWVFFPFGSHPVTGATPTWGSFVWGDGTVFGPLGLTRPEIQLLRGIVRKWKAGRWICRNMIFALQPEAQVVEQSTFAYSLTAGTLNPVIPDAQADDILIAHAEWFGDTGQIGLPAGEGWTPYTGGGGSSVHNSQTWWKRWGSGSTDSLSPVFTAAGIQNGMKILVVRNAVTSGTPLTAGLSEEAAVNAEGLMQASAAGIANDRSLVLRLFGSRNNNDHGEPSEGALVFGGPTHQSIVTLSCSALEGATSSDTGIATMRQRANGPDSARATTLVVRSENTTISYATLAP